MEGPIFDPGYFSIHAPGLVRLFRGPELEGPEMVDHHRRIQAIEPKNALRLDPVEMVVPGGHHPGKGAIGLRCFGENLRN